MTKRPELLRAKSGRKSKIRACLSQSLDDDRLALLPDLELHAMALAEHLGGAADAAE